MYIWVMWWQALWKYIYHWNIINKLWTSWECECYVYVAKAFTKSAPKHRIYNKQWMWNNNKIVAILQRSNTSLRQMSVCCNRHTFVSIQIDVHSFIKLTGCVYPKMCSNNNRSLITQHNGDVLLPIFTVHTNFPFPSYGFILFDKLIQRSIQIPIQ